MTRPPATARNAYDFRHLTDRVADDEQSSSEPRSRPRAPLGRRIALVIYLAFMAYIAVVGFSSVIPQVFWPRAQSGVAAPEGSCEESMAELRDDLRREAGRFVAGETNALETFFIRWDDQYLHIARRCDGNRAYTRLGILRHRVDTTLRQFGRVEGRLFAELDDLDRAHHEQ